MRSSSTLRFRNLFLALAIGSLILASCQSETSLIEKGDAFRKSNKWEDAEIQYRRALQKAPSSAVANLRLGQTLLELKKGREALPYLQRAVEIDPAQPEAIATLANMTLQAFLGSARRPKALYDQLKSLEQQAKKLDPNSFDGLRIEGTLALVDKDYARAIPPLEKASKLQPQHELTTLAMIEALYLSGRGAEAETMGRSAIQANPKQGSIYNTLYGMALKDNKPTEALRILELKVKNFPDQAAPVLQLASYYRDIAKQPDQAKAVLDGLFENKSSYKEGSLAVASFYMDSGDPASAASILERGLARNDAGRSNMRKLLADAYRQIKQNDKAQQQLRLAQQENPEDKSLVLADAILDLEIAKNAEAVQSALTKLDKIKAEGGADAWVEYHRGRALIMLRRETEGVAALQEAIKKQRSHIDARFALASLAVSQNKFADAFQQLDQIDLFAPDNPKALQFRIDTLRVSGRLAEAGNLAQQARRLYPNDYGFVHTLGLIALQSGRGMEAAGHFETLYDKGDHAPRILAGLVESYLLSGNFTKAESILRKEMASNPSDESLKALMAEVQSRSGQTDAAIAILAALDDPKVIREQTLVQLGGLYLKKGDHAKANETFNRLLKAGYTSDVIYASRLFALTSDKKATDVQAHCKEWLARKSSGWTAANNCAFAKAKLGMDLQEAEDLARRVVKEQPNADSAKDTLAFVLMRKGNYKESIHIYNGICAQQPQNSNFLFHRGLALAGEGRTEDARRDFEQALRSKPSRETTAEIKAALAKLG